MSEGFKAPPVPGYRNISPAAHRQVTMNKETEERLLRVMEALKANEDIDPDPRWMSIARTHLDQAWMAFNRAIFKPDRVKLPEDG